MAKPKVRRAQVDRVKAATRAERKHGALLARTAENNPRIGKRIAASKRADAVADAAKRNATPEEFMQAHREMAREDLGRPLRRGVFGRTWKV